MASINRLTPGQIVWDVKRMKQGNFKFAKNVSYPVKILEVNKDENYVVAKWYCEPPRKYYEVTFKKWKVKNPERSSTEAKMNGKH